MTEPITTRGLGRALLARQHLDARVAAPAVDEVAHLVALQSQHPASAYVALWTRVAGFRPDDLADAMLARRVGRLALMRDTVHLVTDRDALALWPVHAPMLRRRVLATPAGTTLRQVDLDDLADAAGAALADGPLTPPALGARLAPRWPGLDPGHLATGARNVLPLVQVTPRGVWGRSLATTWTTAAAWFGAAAHDAPHPDDEVARAATLRDLVRRYLAAFGPATVADLQRWSGLTRLGPVVEDLRDELVELRDADPEPARRPRVLLDLPDAPRPPDDAPVPVRFLPDFDEVLIGHDDRTRIVPPGVRPALASPNGVPPATVLVDGTVAGTWRLVRERLPASAAAPRTRRERAVLTVTPLRDWSRADAASARDESEALVRLLAGDAAEHAVRLAPA